MNIDPHTQPGADAARSAEGCAEAAHGRLPELRGTQQPPPSALPDLEPGSWTYWDVLVVIGFALAAQIIANIGVMFVVLLVGEARGGRFNLVDLMMNPAVLLPVQLIWWVLVFWIIYRIVRARDPRPFPQAVRWVRPHLPPGIYLGGGALLAVSVAMLSYLLPSPNRKMPMEELFRDPTSAFLLAAFGVFAAPPVEELLFRGFLFPVVERSHGQIAAVVATAALFSLVHAQQYGWAWQNLLLLGYVGVIFGTVRAVSRSLIPSTLMHAAYNFTLFAGLYAASKGFHNFNFR
ncbi:MAG TPA: CPBP family intramembrane glutamic endopeptidase [Bryobacterales bacterium]|jgi:membrane protease YdiL (CAAX protease family)|nr:CPBP family intramembrane glutamic endopeptidase [Bryobacterales bacterium]